MLFRGCARQVLFWPLTTDFSHGGRGKRPARWWPPNCPTPGRPPEPGDEPHGTEGGALIPHRLNRSTSSLRRPISNIAMSLQKLEGAGLNEMPTDEIIRLTDHATRALS